MEANSSKPPKPHPREPNPSGALYGELPLKIPRRLYKASHIWIVSRADGVTSYSIRRHMDDDDATVHGLIDTSNEWLFLAGVYLHYNPKLNQYRLKIGDTPVARIIAGQQPSTDPTRTIVDHANGQTLDNRAANLHWVSPSFNSFNNQRDPPSSGFFGVRQVKNRFEVVALTQFQGLYTNAETAALIYNLLIRLAYGDQLAKTPHLLNKVDPASRVTKVLSQADGVEIYRVDDMFVVVYDVRVQDRCTTLEAARQAATSLVADLQAQRSKKEEEWRIKEAQIEVTQKEKGIAYIPVRSKGTELKILLSDQSWKKIQARSASLFTKFGRVFIISDGKPVMLHRWLLGAGPSDVIDHKNRNPFDNRLDNLRTTDRAANSQNVNQTEDGGLKGVRSVRGRWRVTIKIKGEDRAANREFDLTDMDKAIELYDLAALYQHKPGAYINMPEKLEAYISMLEKEETRSYVQAFLAGKREKSSPYKGVTCLNKQEGLFRVNLKGIRTKKGTGKGAEVRLAIFYDLYRLKHTGADFTVNFEWMRPWYLYHVEQIGRHNEDAIVEQAYQLLGGDAFADAEETSASGVEDLSAPPATSSPSLKRKAGD